MNGTIDLPPGQPGKVSVIAVGTRYAQPSGAGAVVFPIVVRNNGQSILYDVSAHATAHLNGATVSVGDSNGFAPAVVHPGEWAYGFVIFSSGSPVAATLDISAVGKTAPSKPYQNTDLAIQTANRTGPNSISGRVSNPSAAAVSGPMTVWVACFDPARVVSVFVFNAIAIVAGELAPNATAPFSVDLPSDSCGPAYAISAQA